MRTHVRIVRTHSVRTVGTVRTHSGVLFVLCVRTVRTLVLCVRACVCTCVRKYVLFFVLANFEKNLLQKKIPVKVQGFHENNP